MNDQAAYKEFLRQHRNIKAPKKSWPERLCELLDYYGNLPPGTSTARYVRSFNYGSGAMYRGDDNVAPTHPKLGEWPKQTFDDLPLFQNNNPVEVT